MKLKNLFIEYPNMNKFQREELIENIRKDRATSKVKKKATSKRQRVNAMSKAMALLESMPEEERKAFIKEHM